MSNYVDLPVKDRMKTVLFSEHMADVHFLVGLEGTSKVYLIVFPRTTSHLFCVIPNFSLSE